MLFSPSARSTRQGKTVPAATNVLPNATDVVPTATDVLPATTDVVPDATKISVNLKTLTWQEVRQLSYVHRLYVFILVKMYVLLKEKGVILSKLTPEVKAYFTKLIEGQAKRKWIRILAKKKAKAENAELAIIEAEFNRHESGELASQEEANEFAKNQAAFDDWVAAERKERAAEMEEPVSS